MEICGRIGFKPNIFHEANNVHSILQVVEAGLGISILPSSLEQQYQELKISFVKLDGIAASTEVVLANKESNTNPVLSSFIERYQELQRES